MNLIDKALGIHPQALSLRSQRSAVLASNIANSSTPGYLARDYDFRTALSQASNGSTIRLEATRSSHLQSDNSEGDFQLMYRLPTRAASHNTVESEVEQAAFAENALRYQASLMFLSRSVSGLRQVIRGE
ncbi:MAG: flagellar basal body rod protein FlgB [Gammaproteobacteria bacterium]